MKAGFVRLGDIVSIKGGGTPDRKNNTFWGGAIPWATVKDFKSTRLNETIDTITEAGILSSATTIVPKGNIIIPTRMSLGKVAINNIDLAINQDLKALCPKNGTDVNYLLWFLLSKAKYIENQGKGATVKGITLDILRNLDVPNICLAEQRRIAAILDKADAIRRKHEQTLALADDFLRSTFLHMFGDPVTNPKGYGVVQLDKAAEIKSGLTKGRNLNGRLSVSLPYMRVANVQDGHIDLSDVKNIEVAEDEVDRFLLCPGDILLTEGGDPDKLGRGSVWQGQINPCVHQNHIFRVRCDSSIADPVFVSSQIGSARGKAYFLRSAKQTTGIASINKTQLREFPLLLPPVHEQTRYAAIVKQIEKWRSNLTSAVCLALNAFSSLSQRAFRGEL